LEEKAKKNNGEGGADRGRKKGPSERIEPDSLVQEERKRRGERPLGRGVKEERHPLREHDDGGGKGTLEEGAENGCRGKKKNRKTEKRVGEKGDSFPFKRKGRKGFLSKVRDPA